MPVTSQAVITRDNVTGTVDAVAYFQVVDAAASVIQVRDWYAASQLVAQTTLRSIVGRHELDQLLSERDRIDAELQVALDAQTSPWGIKVHRVEIRDVGLPAQMQRAMARQAEAERERRAKIIAADGELQASENLAQAAAVIAGTPGALQLRQLQTMVEISAENNSTIIFPIPIDLFEALGLGRTAIRRDTERRRVILNRVFRAEHVAASNTRMARNTRIGSDRPGGETAGGVQRGELGQVVLEAAAVGP